LIEKLNVLLKIKNTNESGVQKKMNVINKLDLTKLMSIIKESGPRKLITRNKLDFKTIESLKKESGQ
jgi:hypothetical protein